MNKSINTSISELSQLSKAFELDFDSKGNLRSLTSKNCHSFLSNLPIKVSSLNQKTVRKLAKQFLASPTIKKVLAIENFKLKVSEIASFDFGYRITFQQMANHNKTMLAVRGGAIHIAIDHREQIFSMSSTLQYGKILPSSSKISKSKAIAIALAKCKKVIKSSVAKLMFASYKNEIQLLYEIILRSESHSYTYLVLARTGKIINEFSKSIYCFFDEKRGGIEASALLITPDPDIPIPNQISKTNINNLPDKQVLKNAYFEMFTGLFARPVYAKDNDTYCYGTYDPEFAAVSVFLTLQKQIELYLSLGLRPPKQPLFVIVEDPLINDNAYFDPQRYEIHIGMGSGVNHGGLTKHIAFDLSVANHEFGHTAVFLQVPGGDLVGELGEAINEAIGDVLGALTMEYLGKIWQARKNGQIFNAEDLKNDLRIIGKYALPPFGIRSVKNDKKSPNDLTGEPHADGLIIGAALADTLVAITVTDGTLEEQIKLFVKLTLTALALLPSYQVSFIDMLRAMITADKICAGGKYRLSIEQCFAAHGIVLDTTQKFDRNRSRKCLALLS